MRRSLAVLSASLLLSTAFVGAVYASVYRTYTLRSHWREPASAYGSGKRKLASVQTQNTPPEIGRRKIEPPPPNTAA